MKTILLTALFCSCVSFALAATPNYSMTATTRIFRGEPSVLVNEDTHTDQAPVIASVSRTDGATTATADATAGFNDLHVRSTDFGAVNSTKLAATSLAVWNDRLFFKRNGQDIATGSIAVTVSVKGVIDVQPPAVSQWFGFTVTLGGAGSGIGLGFNGSYDQLFPLSPQSRSWSASDGLALRFSMSALASNDAPTLSVLTDFSAGARITNIAFIGVGGQPDPTVNISSSSGLIYGIPEPHTLLLAIWSANVVAIVRRRK